MTWRDIHGWFSDEDAECSRLIADSIPVDGWFAEVGSWMGRSLACFAAECWKRKKHPKLFAIDTFKGTISEGEAHSSIVAKCGGTIRHVFDGNMRRIGVPAHVIESDSAQGAGHFADETLDAVFIDADHEREAVRRDVAAWLPKVKRGGIIAGHDADYDDVKRALSDLGLSYTGVGRCWIHNKP